MNTKKIKLFYIFCLLFFCIQMSAAINGPFLWDIDNIQQLKNKGRGNAEFMNWVNAANTFVKTAGPTVMDKPKTWSGDKHNYETVAPYYWPDPNNPQGKYIVLDGKMNPDYNLYDRNRLDELAVRCKTLAIAYYLTGDTSYSTAWLRDMNRWFVDKATKMYPQFDYAQIIPTHTSMGVPGGIIEAYVFTDVVDGILLMDSLGVLSTKVSKAYKKWFKSFVKWMNVSYDGALRFKNTDNIGTAYDVLLYSLSIYTNNTKQCDEIERSFANLRLYSQIEQSGAQTQELQRTLSVKYSIYNLSHIIDLCTMSQKRGKDIYGENKKLIDNAYSFLKDIVDRRDNRKYKESGDWKEYDKEIKTESSRLKNIILPKI